MFWNKQKKNKEEKPEIQLSWDDLQTNTNDLNLSEIYSKWPGMEKFKQIKPLFVTAFGEMIFVGDDLNVYQIDVASLCLNKIEIKESEFKEYINNPETLKNVLMSWLVSQLKKRNLERKKGQVFAFVPHPILGAEINSKSMMVLDLKVWIHICTQLIDNGEKA